MRKGFTLMEVLIVIGIMGILVGIILTTFVSFNKSQALDKDTEAVAEMIRQARSRTMSSQNATTYGVHFTPTYVTLFAGAQYNESDPANEVFTLQTTNTITSIALAGGGSDIIFKRLSGETDHSGTVTISASAISNTRTIAIYKTGIVQ